MKIYRNRQEAGEYLASILSKMNLPQDSLVFALPRGGVPVAQVIAKKLNCSLDLMVVRKIGSPQHPEYAIGAIGPYEVVVLDPLALEHLGPYQAQIQAIIAAEKQELMRREQLYRGGRPYPDLREKTVVIVDDGMATGLTMKAAIQALKTLKPQTMILALPVSSAEAIQALQAEVDRIICPLIPPDFYAVGAWYEEFKQVSDQDVLEFLAINKTN